MGTRRAGSIGSVVLAGVLVAATTATAVPATGDRCQAFGNPGSYTLQITIPARAPLQKGLAFATPGTSVTNLDIQGGNGTPSTSELPLGASAQWLFTGGAASGVLTVTIETTGKVTGPFTVDPSGKTPKAHYAPFTCAFATATASHAFAPHATASYDATARAWDDAVSVPGPGTLEFVQVYTPTGAPLVTRSALPPALIEPGFVNVTGRGSIELELHPSAAGLAALRRIRSLAIYLSVSFRPSGGLPATKVVRLVLRR